MITLNVIGGRTVLIWVCFSYMPCSLTDSESPVLLFEKDCAAMDREIRGATVKVGCVHVNASSVDLPIP